MIRIMRRLFTTMGLGIGLALIAGAAAAELKVGDKAPGVFAAGVRRQDLHAGSVQGEVGASSSPGSPRRSPAAAPRNASRSAPTARRCRT